MQELDDRSKKSIWLKSALDGARVSNRCCKINCSTCGGFAFQMAILFRWAYYFRAEIPKKQRYGTVEILQAEFCENGHFRRHLLDGLSYLDNDDVSCSFEQLKFVFTKIYGRQTIEWHPMIDQNLLNTAAGDLLEKMKEHHKSTEALRSREAIRNDPILAQVRRDEIRAIRAEKHAARIEFFSRRAWALGFKKP